MPAYSTGKCVAYDSAFQHLFLTFRFAYCPPTPRHECFCGDETPKVAAKLPDSSCNMKCTGDPKQICGGYFTMNVYETGIRSERE